MTMDPMYAVPSSSKKKKFRTKTGKNVMFVKMFGDKNQIIIKLPVN